MWKSSPEIQAVLLPDMVYMCLYAWSMSQKKRRKEKSQKLETDEEIDANVGPDTGIGEKQKDY